MPKFHFSIPLPNHAGLIEAQQYLASKLPKGAKLVDPAEFHLTLLMVDDADDATGWSTPANLPVFGMSSDYIRVFDGKSEDGMNAVTLAIMPNPQLTYLQTGLFYEAQAQSAVIGSYSWPGMWKPHVTLAYSPVYDHSHAHYDDCEIFSYEILPSLVVMEAQEFVLNGEDGIVLQRYPFTATIAPAQQISEMKVIRDSVMISEFKGNYPDVPVYDDVDIAELTAGDDDPMFLTLKIAKDGMISGAPNKRHYSAEFVSEMARQIYEKRPVGNQGHVAKEDRATEYPTPVLYWVGTSKVDDFLYGKAYVPIGETRDMSRRTRAAKGQLTTSLYGLGSQTWNAELGAWDIDPNSFALESIDLAPPERAGVPELAGVPHITSEMNDGSDNPNSKTQEGAMPTDNKDKVPETKIVDRATVISEMTEKDFVLLPDVVRDAVLAAAPQTKLVAEMREALSIDEKTDPVATLKTLVAELATIKAESLVAEIKAAVEKEIKVTSVQPVVLELVNARKPQAGQVADVVKEIADSEAVKPLLAAGLVSEMGGRQQRPPADKSGENGDGGPSMLSAAGKAQIEKAKADAN